MIQDSPEAEVEEATLNTRLIGGLIDGLVAFALSMGIAAILPEALEGLSWVLGAAYWVTRDSLPFLKGQNVGKMAMKSKVERLDGSSLIGDWKTGVIRNALLIVPIFGPVIEALILLSRNDRADRNKRLGDDWARTRVVMLPLIS